MPVCIVCSQTHHRLAAENNEEARCPGRTAGRYTGLVAVQSWGITVVLPIHAEPILTHSVLVQDLLKHDGVSFCE